MKRYTHTFLLPFSLGLSALGVALPALWLLVPVGFSLFLVELIQYTKTLSGALYRGIAFAGIVSGAAVIWLLEAFPIGWIGIDSPSVQMAIVVAVWLYVVFSLTPAAMIGCAVIWKMRRAPFFPFVAALIWVLVEQGQMWGFALATWSPHSFFGPHFSFASLGYVLTESPLLLPAAYPFGSIGLTFLLVLVAAAVAQAIAWRTVQSYQAALFPMIVAVLLVSVPTLLPKEDSLPTANTLEVALVSSTIPIGGQATAYAPKIESLVEQAFTDEQNPDVVVLPEGLGLAYAYPSPEVRKIKVAELTQNEPTVFIYSGRDTAEGASAIGRIAYVNERLETLGTYQKMFLMPLGEYVPVTWLPLLSLLQNKGSLENSYASRVEEAINPGTTLDPVSVQGVRFGTLLCSDLASPTLYKTLSRRGADVLVNSGNQNWFHESRPLFWKNLQIARVHAVQNQTYFLSANNGSPSYALRPDGSVMALSGWEPMVLHVELP